MPHDAVFAVARPAPRVPARAPAGLLACVAAACLLGGCDKNITDNDIEFASLADVKRLADGAARSPKSVLLVDPRSEQAYAQERLPGAVNLTLPMVDEEADRDPTIQSYDQIVVYGNNPASPPARAMTKRLLAAGYEDVRMFPGGLDEWKGAGFGVETGPPTHTIPARRRMR